MSFTACTIRNKGTQKWLLVTISRTCISPKKQPKKCVCVCVCTCVCTCVYVWTSHAIFLTRGSAFPFGFRHNQHLTFKQRSPPMVSHTSVNFLQVKTWELLVLMICYLGETLTSSMGKSFRLQKMQNKATSTRW